MSPSQKPAPMRLSGTVVVHPRGFGFLELPDGESAFIAPPELNRFLADDLVEADVRRDDTGRLSAAALSLSHRGRRRVFGTIARHKDGLFLRVDRQVSNTDWKLAAGSASAPEENSAWVAEIVGEEAKLLTKVRATDVSLARVLARYDIPTEFVQAQLDAAEAAAPVKVEHRRDLRELDVVTIDAPVSRDLDDGVAALPADADGGIRVFVCIADVDSLVEEGTSLDLEARARGTSVYLAGHVVPMIPPALSERTLSLLPGEERPALTVEMRIDPEGRTTSVDIYEAFIRSRARLSYTQVAEVLDEGEESSIPEDVRPTLRWLRAADARLKTMRDARGGVQLLREEANIKLDPESGEPVSIKVRPDTRAHRLIERLMVAANEAVAGWLVDRGLPGVFRIHDAPGPDRIEALEAAAAKLGVLAGFGGRALTPKGLAGLEHQFRGTPLEPAMATLLSRALGPAKYTAFAGPHFGLASERYLHFTSPIRRYADLTVHRIIKRYLRGARAAFPNPAGLEALCEALNDAAYRAGRAEADRTWMLAARHYANRIGETMRGHVVDIKSFGLVVQLAGTGVKGTVSIEALGPGPYRLAEGGHALVVAHEATESRRDGDATRDADGDFEVPPGFAIGDPLTVRIAGTNEEMGRIELELADGADRA